MSRFTIQPKPLAGVVEINRKVIGDHRGYFTRFSAQTNWPPPALTARSRKSITRIPPGAAPCVGCIFSTHRMPRSSW